MRLPVALLIICLATLLMEAMPLPQDEEGVRGAFLTSRSKEKAATSTSTNSKPPSRRGPKRVSSSSGTRKTTTSDDSGTPAKTTNTTTTTTTKATTKVNGPKMGLGLTLFMRDSNGLAVRTDPTHVFQNGDRVRILLESNVDGYLYIFNTTNGGSPVMIYPDAHLDEAGNYLKAHIPFEIPSSVNAEERFRWLAFDENAGDERLFFVFSREPLVNVPIEDDLVGYCRDAKTACNFRPTDDVWQPIVAQLNEPLQMDRTKTYGSAQTTSEKQATARGIGLSQDDPEPSLIMMASSRKPTLVTSLDLIHK